MEKTSRKHIQGDSGAVLIRNHGITVWGRDSFDAKKRLEAYEFLFQFHIKLLSIQGGVSMAQIRIHEINTRIENEVEVSKFLQEEGVLYEKWNISKLPTHLKENYSLTDENKAEILAVFFKRNC